MTERPFYKPIRFTKPHSTYCSCKPCSGEKDTTTAEQRRAAERKRNGL